jgi:DNA-directed RNA polymerase alpha subunit
MDIWKNRYAQLVDVWPEGKLEARVLRILQTRQIQTVRQLVALNESDLLRMEHLGRKSLDLINRIMGES